MVTGLATDAQEQCPCSPMGGTDWDPWRAEKGGRRAAQGQEGSTKNHVGIQLVKRYRQRAPPPPSPDQPCLMLWRASPTAKVPAIAKGPACTPVPRWGKSTAKRMGEARGGHRQREDPKGRSVFLYHSKFFLVGYEQDELRVAGVIASRSNQGAQGLPLVCQSLGKTLLGFTSCSRSTRVDVVAGHTPARHGQHGCRRPLPLPAPPRTQAKHVVEVHIPDAKP